MGKMFSLLFQLLNTTTHPFNDHWPWARSIELVAAVKFFFPLFLSDFLILLPGLTKDEMSLWYHAVVFFFLATPVARAARVLKISQTNESTPRLCHTTPDPAQGHRPPPSPGLLCGFPPSHPNRLTPAKHVNSSAGLDLLWEYSDQRRAVLSSQHIQRLLELQG
jgi:hypothetical protein